MDIIDAKVKDNVNVVNDKVTFNLVVDRATARDFLDFGAKGKPQLIINKHGVDKGLVFVRPLLWSTWRGGIGMNDPRFAAWNFAMNHANRVFNNLQDKPNPDAARGIIPDSAAVNVKLTATVDKWHKIVKKAVNVNNADTNHIGTIILRNLKFLFPGKFDNIIPAPIQWDA